MQSECANSSFFHTSDNNLDVQGSVLVAYAEPHEPLYHTRKHLMMIVQATNITVSQSTIGIELFAHFLPTTLTRVQLWRDILICHPHDVKPNTPPCRQKQGLCLGRGWYRISHKCGAHASSDTLLSSIDIATIRSKHHICGILVGTLPHLSQQNVFLGVPLLLMPEEAVLLVENGPCT